MKQKTYLTIFLAFFLTACQPSAEELIPTYLAATANANQTATAHEESVNATIAAQISPTPTATETPIPTATATATITPTPVLYAEVLQEAFIREGPGTIYRSSGQAAPGQSYEVLGQSEDGNWLAIKVAVGIEGWLELSNVELSFEPGQLTVIESPPTPLPSTATITIINNASARARLVFLDWQGNIIKDVTVRPGQEAVFTLDKDYYFIAYGVGGLCEDIYVFNLNMDILWMPDDTFRCGYFP